MKQAATIVLVVLGLAQMVGDLADWPVLKGVAAATGVSPAPKVFSAVRGLETFSTRFFLEWHDRAGIAQRLEITPEVYSRLRGPYNRRNVYGAVLAYGPILLSDPKGRPMFDAVAGFAFCGEAPLLRELGVDPVTVVGRVRVRLEPRPGSSLGDLALKLEAPCP